MFLDLKFLEFDELGTSCLKVKTTASPVKTFNEGLLILLELKTLFKHENIFMVHVIHSLHISKLTCLLCIPHLDTLTMA